jgi:hypothetical protein
MPETQIVLGFDVSLNRIGVAIGNLITRDARPLLQLNSRDKHHRFIEIEQLIRQVILTAHHCPTQAFVFVLLISYAVGFQNLWWKSMRTIQVALPARGIRVFSEVDGNAALNTKAMIGWTHTQQFKF